MEENKYTRDQIKDAIWQELKESDYAGENNDRAYEVIGIVMAGIDKIVGEPQPGAVWVKASRFDIKRNVVYHAIYEDKNQITKGSGFFNINDWFMWDNKEIEERYKDDWDKLLILDESGTAAGREEDAVAFAEWIRANHYNPYGNRWRRTGSNLERSSTQLYELFKQKEK